VDPIFVYILIGFFAQLVDGSLGMGYKATSTTVLLSTGVPPVAASASVHTAGIFTSAVGGIAHWRLGNFAWDLFIALVIPGMIGAVIGVVVLTSMPTAIIKPVVAFYQLLLGLLLVTRAIWGSGLDLSFVRKEFVGAVGGFFDAVGGGGWGPIVNGTMIAKGTRKPRRVIGSANIAEWFVTVVQVAAFMLMFHDFQWTPVLGLIIGGVPAAPIAAMITRRLPVQKLMAAVGGLLVILSLRTLLIALSGG
jgi:hypothetical protein